MNDILIEDTYTYDDSYDVLLFDNSIEQPEDPYDDNVEHYYDNPNE